MLIVKQLWILLIVLGVGWVALQEYKISVVKETIKEIEVETLKQNEVVRERAKDAVKENQRSNPTADPNIALEQLRKRQSAH